MLRIAPIDDFQKRKNLKFENNLLQRSIDTCRDYVLPGLFRFNFVRRLNR